MRVKALYQEGPAFLAPIKSHAKPRTFFWAPNPFHYTKPSNPQSSLIDSTPPGPQRSFPQSQAEVPRGSQDPGPSRPNGLTPNLRNGFPILLHLSSCVLSVLFVRSGCAAAQWPCPRKSSCHLTLPVTNSVAG